MVIRVGPARPVGIIGRGESESLFALRHRSFAVLDEILIVSPMLISLSPSLTSHFQSPLASRTWVLLTFRLRRILVIRFSSSRCITTNWIVRWCILPSRLLVSVKRYVAQTTFPLLWTSLTIYHRNYTFIPTISQCWKLGLWSYMSTTHFRKSSNFFATTLSTSHTMGNCRNFGSSPITRRYDHHW